MQNIDRLIKALGFIPKENTSDIYIKKYADSYAIEIDFAKKNIHYGTKIVCESKTTSNFSQPENLVVLECVDRLLNKGYKPELITLEKTWGAGHGTSGRLDICVHREDGSEFLLIECKTYGKEFDKEFDRMKKDGGQLFTYFKFSNKADVILLYASELANGKIIYRNEIVKIEDEYRTGDVKDFYDKWNKLTKDNGVFEAWAKPYNYESRALTPKLLKPITESDSSLIFNQFLEILRHNVVSDKPNAFNKIFSLFLCKVYDEKTTRPNEELKFQWIDGKDELTGENAYVDFLIRLSDLYKNGMLEFLEKEITDFSEKDFNKKYHHLDDSIKKDLLKEFYKIRLEKNNEFAIKEVFDKQSFLENAKIVKEVVELLQGFKIRYNERQQFLSNFFELLLTTGLKQETGQFFTPVPIAQFVIKSLPIDSLVNEKLQKGSLPYLIDYAAGSGHFVIESMHEIQRIINTQKNDEFTPIAQEKITKWQSSHFDWATQFVYGVEKDYRLVKVGKVGCYLHGDGLANVLLSDGLGSFKTTKEYKGLLKETKADFPQDNGQFDILISNPPYSVASFKRTTTDYYTNQDFELYNHLTDNSSEIECLFIERTKQLLKDGGVAGVILPSSILSNAGIYTKAREIILQYFDIVAITELGSNTFMATGTNTVILFLRRKNNYESINLRIGVDKLFANYQDITLNGVEYPIKKYISHAWKGLSVEDYISLLKQNPTPTISEHELYKDYRKKIKAKNDKDFYDTLIAIEKEKIFYFIIAYPQQVILVKSGEKDAEKRFLGYEFSNRRGSEGIHPIQRGKSIEDCTQLFDANTFTNPTKASTYIYHAFNGNYTEPINEDMANNVSRCQLVDMLTFDRSGFVKDIKLSVEKKVKIESKWEVVKLGDVCELYQPKTITSQEILENGEYKVFGANGIIGFYNKYNHEDSEVAITCRGATCGTVNFTEPKSWITGNAMVAKPKVDFLHKMYLYTLLVNTNLQSTITGAAQPQITRTNLEPFPIPLPPLDVQQKIVDEIAVLEAQEQAAKTKVEELRGEIDSLFNYDDSTALRYLLEEINPSKSEIIGLDNNTEVSFLGMADVSNDGKIINLQKRKLKDVKTGFTFFQNDDILVAKITPCTENGKGTLISDLSNNIGFGSTEFFVLRANKEKLLPRILFHFTQSKDFRVKAEKNMTGTSGHRRVPKSFIEEYPIPLIPLAEQQRIVAEIEQIEEQIAALEKQISEIPEQKESILKKYL